MKIKYTKNYPFTNKGLSMEHLEAIFGRLNHVRFGEDQRQESFELAELLESIRIQPAEVNFVLEVE